MSQRIKPNSKQYAAIKNRRALLTALRAEHIGIATIQKLETDPWNAGSFSLNIKRLTQQIEHRVTLDRLYLKLVNHSRADLSSYERALLTFEPIAKIARKDGRLGTALYHDLTEIVEEYESGWEGDATNESSEYDEDEDEDED